MGGGWRGGGIRVDAVGDEDVVVVLDGFDDVREAGVGVDHGEGSERLRGGE